MTPTKKLLIIGFVWPEPKSSAAGSRMMQLIQFFKDQNWSITFASTANDSGFMSDLAAYNVRTESIEMNDKSFDHFVREINPDMILFDRFMTEEQFGWRVQSSVPGAIRILDTEDLHSLRYGRMKAVKEGREFSDDDLISDLAKREIAAIYRSDLSLIISEAEMAYLEKFYKVKPELLLYLPYALNPITEADVETWPSFEARQHFISIGNFRHKPNLDSVLFLKEEIWPLIRSELPDSELHLYGAYPSQQVTDLHKPSEGFMVKGRAEDSKQVMSRAKLCLAPLRFGAGLKGKFIEAMQCGTPSITTNVGAEGIHGEFDWPGHVTDDPVEFASEAIRYYKMDHLWMEAQKKGIQIINERFNLSNFKKALSERLDTVTKNINTHRRNNFTGAMLMHHTMASTRFMSRWIEEKNRDKNG